MAEAKNNKARYWTAVLYPESMVENWEEIVGDVLQYPFAYCVHDKCKTKEGEPRKVHVHFILAFPNTTTYNYAKSVFEGLGVCNKIERVISIRNAYEYLIHNTESSIKQNKYLYPVKERITGNNFDIGAYEQLTVTDKLTIKKELANIVRSMHFFNFDDFDEYVSTNLTLEHYQIMCENQGYFNNLVRGHYNKIRAIALGEYDMLMKAIAKAEADAATKKSSNDEPQ